LGGERAGNARGRSGKQEGRRGKWLRKKRETEGEERVMGGAGAHNGRKRSRKWERD